MLFFYKFTNINSDTYDSDKLVLKSSIVIKSCYLRVQSCIRNVPQYLSVKNFVVHLYRICGNLIFINNLYNKPLEIRGKLRDSSVVMNWWSSYRETISSVTMLGRPLSSSMYTLVRPLPLSTFRGHVVLIHKRFGHIYLNWFIILSQQKPVY